MEHQLITLIVTLIIVQIISGLRLDRYADHPILPNDPYDVEVKPPGFKSNPPYGNYSKKRFNSLGMDGELRRYQKATNSPRRNNIDDFETDLKKLRYVHRMDSHLGEQNENAENWPTTGINDENSIDRTVDVVKDIRNLFWTSIIEKYRKLFGDVINEKYCINESKTGDDEYVEDQVKN